MVRGGLLLGISWDDVKICKMTPICGWLMGWFIIGIEHLYAPSIIIYHDLSVYQSVCLS